MEFLGAGWFIGNYWQILDSRCQVPSDQGKLGLGRGGKLLPSRDDESLTDSDVVAFESVGLSYQISS